MYFYTTGLRVLGASAPQIKQCGSPTYCVEFYDLVLCPTLSAPKCRRVRGAMRARARCHVRKGARWSCCCVAADSVGEKSSVDNH